MAKAIKKVSIVFIATVFILLIFFSIWVIPEKAYAETYELGKTGPSGGIIFYDKGNDSDGWRYLEAAPLEQRTGIWSDVISIIGTTGSSIGTGKANTAAIIAQSPLNTNIAARICADYSLNGYDDWFLPSKDELKETYKFKSAIGFPGGGFFWSSTEVHYDEIALAVAMDVWDGSTGVWDKTVNLSVLPIRAFSVNATAESEKTWVRDTEMKCKAVWINEDGDFQFSFIYPYANNNWVKIFDMSGKEVFGIDMPYDNPNIIVDLPDGMYTVKTFHDQAEPLQEFVIGKP